MSEQADTSAADFEAGFGNEVAAPAPTETPEPVAAEPTPEPVAEPEPAPEYAQITKTDYDALLAKAAQVDSLKSDIDRSFGKIGEMNRYLQQLQNQTPAGSKVEVPPETMAKLTALNDSFPEIIGPIIEAFSGIKGTGTTTQPTFDPAQFDAQIDARVKPSIEKIDSKVEQIVETRLLTKAHKDWRQVAEGTEFKTWVGKQPAEFVTQLNETWDSDFISDALTKFKNAQQTAKATAAARQKRIEAAVTPRSTGGHAPAGNTDLDEFMAGFNG